MKIEFLKPCNVFSSFKYYLKNLYIKLDKDFLWTFGSGIAFNFLFSLIPFFLVVLTILGVYLDKSDILSKINYQLNIILPVSQEFKETILTELIARAEELIKNTYTTGIIGVVGLFWTISGLFASMRDTMNKIYNYSEEHNFVVGKLKDFFLVIIFIILFLLSIIITSATQIIHIYEPEILGVKFDLTSFQSIGTFVFGFITTFLLFFILFRHVPHFKIPYRAIFFASFITSLLFEISKYFFTLYIFQYSNYGKIYGTFAAIVIIFLWIYIISIIFTLGATMGELFIKRHNLEIRIKKKNKVPQKQS